MLLAIKSNFFGVALVRCESAETLASTGFAHICRAKGVADSHLDRPRRSKEQETTCSFAIIGSVNSASTMVDCEFNNSLDIKVMSCTREASKGKSFESLNWHHKKHWNLPCVSFTLMPKYVNIYIEVTQLWWLAPKCGSTCIHDVFVCAWKLKSFTCPVIQCDPITQCHFIMIA